jgi:hypothetical protein
VNVEPTPLPAMRHNRSGFELLQVSLFCADADLPEVIALVDRCHAGNAKVGNA